MPVNPFKVAPRTLFEAERIKGEKRYKRLLDGVMRKIQNLISKQTTPSAIKRVLENLINSKLFNEFCSETARKAVTNLAAGEYRTWRAAAAASSKGRSIFNALKREQKFTGRGARINDIIDENAKLIKTVPQKLANEFSHLAQERQQQGIRPEEITKEILQKAPHLTDVEARRIARTESAKAATALTQARCEDLGLEFYIWYTCHDQRVRDSHEFMDGVICRWSDPPNPERLAGEKSSGGSYHPGGIYNCRCIPMPVMNESDLRFPLRAHLSGKIHSVNNLQAFRRLYGLSNGAAGSLYASQLKRKQELITGSKRA